VGLLQQDGKRPDGTTILPWSRGKPLAWDVTVPDTYADAYVSNKLWKQELQPALPPPTRPTNTAKYPQLTCSLQWRLKQPVPGTTRQLSWSMGTGKAGDHNYRRLQRDHLPVPAVISGFAKGKLTRSRFKTHSQPAGLLQPVIYFS